MYFSNPPDAHFGSFFPELPDSRATRCSGFFYEPFYYLFFELETNIYNAHKYYTRMYIYTVQNNKLTKRKLIYEGNNS